jgi:hypothetical protein
MKLIYEVPYEVRKILNEIRAHSSNRIVHLHAVCKAGSRTEFWEFQDGSSRYLENRLSSITSRLFDTFMEFCLQVSHNNVWV